MPMELDLELVTVVGPHFANAEWKFFDDVVNEVDGVCLRMFLVDLEGANSGCIVDRCVLEATDRFAVFSLKGPKLNIYLNLMARHLLLITFGMQFAHAHACTSGPSVEAVTFENAVDPRI